MAIMLGAGTLKEGWGIDIGDITRARQAAQRGEKVRLSGIDSQPKKK
jgi:hypothetical protein